MLALAISLSSSAWADGSEQARRQAGELANQGFALFTDGDYAEAIILFQQAEALIHSPVILSYVAQSYEALGRLVEAQQTYARIVNEPMGDADPDDFRKAQALARRQAPLLQRRVPRLLLQVSGMSLDDVEVRLDGTLLDRAKLDKALPVNPGERTLVLKPKGHAPLERRFSASERQISQVEVVFADSPVGQAGGDWVAPAIAFGVGFAGLTLGAVSTALYFGGKGSLDDGCSGSGCPPGQSVESDTVDALGIVALVGWGTALAGIGVGTTLVIVGGDDESDAGDGAQAALRATFGPGSLWLLGSF